MILDYGDEDDTGPYELTRDMLVARVQQFHTTFKMEFDLIRNREQMLSGGALKDLIDFYEEMHAFHSELFETFVQ